MTSLHNFRTGIIAICAALTLLCASCATGTREEEDKNSPKQQALLYSEMGTQALGREDYPQAISDLRKAIELDPNNPGTHNNLALAYYRMGQKQLATAEWQKALKIDPKFSDAYVNLGSVAFENEKNSEARKFYLKALDNLEYKTRHRALTSLAQLALRENKTDEARQLLYQSLQANADYCLSHYLLGTLLSKDGNDGAAALEFKKSVRETCTNNVEGHYQLGLSYLKSKQYSKAKSEFMLLVEQYPGTIQGQRAGDQLRNIP